MSLAAGLCRELGRFPRRGLPGGPTFSTPAGGMPGYLSRPGSDDRWPGMVVLHDGFGIDEAVRAQSDWLSGAGYLALSVDLGFRGRPSACLLRMFRDLRAGRGRDSDRWARHGRGWRASPDAAVGLARSGSALPTVSPC